MNNKGMIGVLISVGLVIILFVAYLFFVYSSVDNVTITIKDKERIQDGSSSYYLVFTENEVYKNSDDIWFMKFDSSNIYNDLDVGSTYNVKVNWFRIPFFSSYKNIIEIK